MIFINSRLSPFILEQSDEGAAREQLISVH